MSLLSLNNVTKTFGGLIAVDGVSFNVNKGAIFGLIGPNGAGKTTVFNLITGNYKVDSGSVFFEGADITGKITHKIVESGIARTFQTIRLFSGMSVLENVLAGFHCRMTSGPIAAMLRRQHFTGYIHLKVIPGASDAAIEEAVSLANNVSINIEVPGEKNFQTLCSSKHYLEDVIRPMKLIHEMINIKNITIG